MIATNDTINSISIIQLIVTILRSDDFHTTYIIYENETVNFAASINEMYLAENLSYAWRIDNCDTTSNTNHKNLLKEKIFFIFAFENFKSIPKILNYRILDQWHPENKILIIISGNVLNKLNAINGIMTYLWSKWILNIAIVLCSNIFEIYTYNPFINNFSMKIFHGNITFDNNIMIPNSVYYILYPDKVKNLNGMHLTAVIGQDMGMVYRKNGPHEAIGGCIVYLVETICEKMNGKMIYHLQKTTEIMKDTMEQGHLDYLENFWDKPIEVYGNNKSKRQTVYYITSFAINT